jgi:hypothetical protein
MNTGRFNPNFRYEWDLPSGDLPHDTEEDWERIAALEALQEEDGEE